MKDEEQKRIFSNNLNHYISLNGKQQNEVANAIGEKPTTFNMWCTGKSMPSMGKIQKLADYFGIGKTDLTDDTLSRTGDDAYTSVAFQIGIRDKRFQRIIIDYYRMPKKDKELFCDFYERFIQGRRG